MPEDLEARIAQWRTRMAAAMPGRRKEIAELEDHLRTHIDRLTSEGRSPAEAWAEGTRRIGDPRLIAGEFNRVGSSWAALPLSVRLVHGLCALLTFLIVVFAARLAILGELEILLIIHATILTVGYLAVVSAGLVALVALIKAARGVLSPLARGGFKRSIFQLTLVSAWLVPLGVILGMVWAADNLGGAWSWAPVEVGALVVVLTVMTLVIAQYRRISDRLQWSVAALGNGAVLIAIIAAERPQTAVPFGWVCLAFVTTLAALVLLRPSADPVASD